MEVLGVLDQLEPTSAGHQMAPVRGGEHQSPARPQQRRPAAESLGTVDQVLDDLAGEDGVEGSLVKGNVLGGPHHTEAHSPLTDVAHRGRISVADVQAKGPGPGHDHQRVPGADVGNPAGHPGEQPPHLADPGSVEGLDPWIRGGAVHRLLV